MKKKRIHSPLTLFYSKSQRLHPHEPRFFFSNHKTFQNWPFQKTATFGIPTERPFCRFRFPRWWFQFFSCWFSPRFLGRWSKSDKACFCKWVAEKPFIYKRKPTPFPRAFPGAKGHRVLWRVCWERGSRKTASVGRVSGARIWWEDLIFMGI